MAGQAAPSVRGRSSIRRRVEEIVWLFVGFGVGGLLLVSWLAAISWAARHVIPGGTSSSVILLIPIVALLAGDVLAIVRQRHYPLTMQRQTPQTLMFRGLDQRLVAFAWAADVGTGVTTYRVTSGVWILSLLVIFGGLTPWCAVAYTVGFVVAMAGFIAWPTSGEDSEQRASNSAMRAARVAYFRRHAQATYLSVASALFIFGGIPG